MMRKLVFFLFFFGVLQNSHAQFSESNKDLNNSIEGLQLFPNPVHNGKLYITTKQNLTKAIKIYDVLGKQVMTTTLQSKTLNISRLSPGIYILKIKENYLTATRKLVVR